MVSASERVGAHRFGERDNAGKTIRSLEANCARFSSRAGRLKDAMPD